MLFSSISFIYYFLPVVLAACFLMPESPKAPGRNKNIVLLISSLIFYAWGEPRYVVLMVISILIGYTAGRVIESTTHAALKKAAMSVSIGICLIILGVFKYADFFAENVNRVSGLSLPVLRLALPIGISFYTFQLISYIVDVYRGEVPAQRSLLKLGVYISMFPQLIAGPIVRYKDIEERLEHRCMDLEGISYGVSRFALGLGKKVLIANTVGELCTRYAAAGEQTVLFSWMYALAATLQIYFDFSGYSDMAIGLGSILGFTFPENFRHPLASKSVTEFWRRWHISLGSWFRDYLYIPLGGSRVSAGRHIFNIMLVWMATGLWHGASWNFVAWGLYYGILLILEKKLYGRYLEKLPILNHIYLILITLFGFVIFDGESLSAAGETLLLMLGQSSIQTVHFSSAETLFYLRDYGFLMLIAILGALGIPGQILAKLQARHPGTASKLECLQPFFSLAMLVLSTAFLVNGSFNPFLYFRF